MPSEEIDFFSPPVLYTLALRVCTILTEEEKKSLVKDVKNKTHSFISRTRTLP